MGSTLASTAAALLYLVALFCACSLASGRPEARAGTGDGLEEWGYVEVRPGANMFWWLYRSPERKDSSSKAWPIILWLQGGPGASGVGIGNFQEIGPLDENLKPRNSTWLQKADLLFVDNPVGTGFSFVKDEKLLVTTDEAAASDMTTLLMKLFNKNQQLQTSPLFIVAESYGGKYAVTLGLAIVKAVEEGRLKLTYGGVALGDSWISPEDFVFSWGPLLRDVSRLDANAANQSNSMALQIRHQLENGQYKEATSSWSDLEGFIKDNSNNVDFYNFLLDADSDSASMETPSASAARLARKYSNYLRTKKKTTYLFSSSLSSGDFSSFMDGVVRKKLKIIPDNVRWGEQSDLVFNALENDFMKPRIDEVDELLSKGVHVTVYNGQVDLICATKGAEAWVSKLRWPGLENFTEVSRIPLYCGETKTPTKGFKKSYQNFNFYWILGAGHFVPADQPCISLQMVDEITQSHRISSNVGNRNKFKA